jgi:hypothetical protein
MRVFNNELLENQKIYQIDLMSEFELTEANAWTDFHCSAKTASLFFYVLINKLSKIKGV